MPHRTLRQLSLVLITCLALAGCGTADGSPLALATPTAATTPTPFPANLATAATTPTASANPTASATAAPTAATTATVTATPIPASPATPAPTVTPASRSALIAFAKRIYYASGNQLMTCDQVSGIGACPLTPAFRARINAYVAAGKQGAGLCGCQITPSAPSSYSATPGASGGGTAMVVSPAENGGGHPPSRCRSCRSTGSCS